MKTVDGSIQLILEDNRIPDDQMKEIKDHISKEMKKLKKDLHNEHVDMLKEIASYLNFLKK